MAISGMQAHGTNTSSLNTNNSKPSSPVHTPDVPSRFVSIDQDGFPATTLPSYAAARTHSRGARSTEETGRPAPIQPRGSATEPRPGTPASNVQQAGEHAPPQQLETRLIFGLGPSETPELGVSEETWNNFLEHEVLPRFPDAKSIDAYGQYQWQDGRGIARQYSKILIIDHSDTAENRSKIEEIRNSWKEYSAQESVMKVTFGDKTLQENEGESASKWVETRLTVDLNLPEESLSEEKWRGFVDTIITPRFPDGLSAIVPDGNEASRRGMTAQRSIQVIIDHTDTPENRAKIEEIRSYWKAYSGKEMRKDIYKVKVSF